MNKLLPTKLEHKMEMYERWKQVINQEQNRDAIQERRGGIREAKAHLELNLERGVKGNKKAHTLLRGA